MSERRWQRRRASERVYALLLWLYPPALRREYGADMRQAFRDLLRGYGAWRAWTMTLGDLAPSAQREWAHEMRQARRGWVNGGRQRRAYGLATIRLGRSGVEPRRGMTMNQKFDKFNERTQQVLVYAQEEARSFGHNYIGTEHLLLGMLRDENSVACRALRNLGVELETARQAVEFIIGRGEHPVAGDMGLTPRSKKVIELAVDEARRLNAHYIGTEHLLLGLIREGEGIAAGVMRSQGVELGRARAEVLRILGAQGAGTVADAEVYAESKALDWFAGTILTLVCRDVSATRTFYVDYLGASEITAPANAQFTDGAVTLRLPRGGVMLSLRQADPASGETAQTGAGAIEIGFFISDIGLLWNDFNQRSAPTLTPLAEMANAPRLRSFTLTDPDGRVLRFRGVFRQ